MRFPVLSEKREKNKKQSLEADSEASVFMAIPKMSFYYNVQTKSE